MIQDYENSSTLTEDLAIVTPSVKIHEEGFHYAPKNFRDRFAKFFVRTLAESADFFFKERYGHRAIVLETLASVPGIIGGMLQHLKSLRLIRDDKGWIKTLLDEAENERVHLFIYNELARPTRTERFLIIFMQFFFSITYFLMYFFSPKTAHRVVGYFEEEAVRSYEHFLRLVEEGTQPDVEATSFAIQYWNLGEGARLSDMIRATIKDEIIHRDVNHRFANDEHGTRLWR